MASFDATVGLEYDMLLFSSDTRTGSRPHAVETGDGESTRRGMDVTLLDTRGVQVTVPCAIPSGGA